MIDRTWEDRSIAFNATDYSEGAEWVKTKTPSVVDGGVKVARLECVSLA